VSLPNTIIAFDKHLLYLCFAQTDSTKTKVSPLKAMSQAHNYNVIILCCLYDAYLTVFSFFEVIPITFQAIQNHHVEQCASEASQLKEIIYYVSALIYLQNFLIWSNNSVKIKQMHLPTM